MLYIVLLTIRATAARLSHNFLIAADSDYRRGVCEVVYDGRGMIITHKYDMYTCRDRWIDG